MYETFFGLKCEAFSVAADPRFLYLSPKHRQARAHLRHGLRRGAGFILLTGEIGAGKTTVCRLFLRQMPPNADVAFVVNPRLDARTLLTRVCEDLRIEIPEGAGDLIDIIHGHLLLAHSQGRRTVIVVDEAQALSMDVLEQLRLLTNLDATGEKLQVFLVGQPELRTLLKAPALKALEQRIVARFHLSPLSKEETALYIQHRMAVAGLVGPVPFDGDALRAVHRLSGGIPRRINVLCDHTLTAAETRGTLRVDHELVESVAVEAFDTEADASADEAAVNLPPPPPAESRRWISLVAVAAVAVFIGALFGRGHVRFVPAIAAAPMPAQTPPAAPAPASTPSLASTSMPASDALPSASLLTSAAHAATQEPATASPLYASLVPTELPVRTPPPAAHPAQLGQPSHLKDIIDAAYVDEPSAWRDLARLWNVKVAPGQPCVNVAQLGLRCYRTTGGMTAVREVGRPVIVKLTTDSGDDVYAVLVGLTDSSATFRSGESELSVPLTELAGRWHGDLATLWRLPSGYHAGNPAAPDGVLAAWMAHRLTIAAGPAAPSVNADNLTAGITAFQVAHGLQPDGLAGPMTLMRLNRESGVDEPQLRDH
jgi:general secretion pathway protein A